MNHIIKNIKNISTKTTLALTLAAFACTSASGGTDVRWEGRVDSDWFKPGNWYSFAVPQADDFVTVDAAQTKAENKVIVDGGSLTLQNSAYCFFDFLTDGKDSFSDVDINSSSHLQANTVVVADLQNSDSSLNLNNSSANIETLTLGSSGGGQLRMDASDANLTNPTLGLWYSSQGIIEAESSAISAGVLSIGIYGEGRCILDEYSSLTCDDCIIAQGPGSSGYLETRGNLTINGALMAGLAGEAEILIDGPTTVSEILLGSHFIDNYGSATMIVQAPLPVTNNTYIAEDGEATVNVENTEFTAKDCYLGISRGIIDVYEEDEWVEQELIANGTLSLNKSAAGFQNIFIGDQGRGIVEINNNSSLNVEDRIYIAHSASGSGLLILDSGQINADELFIGGGNIIFGDDDNSTDDDIYTEQNGTIFLGHACPVNLSGGVELGMFGAIDTLYGVFNLDGAYWKNSSFTKMFESLDDLKSCNINFSSAANTMEADSNASAINQYYTVKLNQDAQLQLRDDFDNTPNTIGSDKLYVRTLILEEGSQLDLNGLELICLNLINNGGTITENGGTLKTDSRTIAIDFNFDGVVNIFDFLIFKSQYGQLTPIGTLFTVDLNEDGEIDIFDFLIFKQYYTRVE